MNPETISLLLNSLGWLLLSLAMVFGAAQPNDIETEVRGTPTRRPPTRPAADAVLPSAVVGRGAREAQPYRERGRA